MCFFPFCSRHIQSNAQPPQTPIPPLGYVSGTLISDLETDIPEDEDEDDLEEESIDITRPLRGLEHTPGSSMDNLDSSVTGRHTKIKVNPICKCVKYVINNFMGILFCYFCCIKHANIQHNS